MPASLLFALLIVAAVSQNVGTNQAENHPQMTTQTCVSKGQCSQNQNSVVLDSNWRWTHNVGGSTNCYTGNTWDQSLCPDPQTCAQNCAIDGADYSGTYGITSGGNSLRLNFVTHGPYSTNIGSRVYLLESDTQYKLFKLRGQEFTFDVDVSQLPCGLNGALYFVEMPQDGGMSQYPTNKAGAKYGTGYCDAQCPHDLKWIDGEANIIDWTPSPNDPNSGTGKYGTCCPEMDIWEANSMSTAYTAHPCSINGPYKCSGTECGDGSNRYGGVCDKDGCDFNSYRLGNTTFYNGMIDTTKPFTVVTQFPSDDTGAIKRIYVQNGKVFSNSYSKNLGSNYYNDVSTDFCNKQKQVFGDKNDFLAKGGLDTMLKAFDNGMVLVMSLWDDYSAHMLWLDSDYPLDKPSNAPGVARGACSTSSGNPQQVQSQYPNAYVKFSNIRTGPHGSTF